MFRLSIGALLLLATACGGGGDAGIPGLLSEAGLYSDIGARTLADGVRAFRPRFELWSDGAKKQRWVLLPEGRRLDASSMDFWQFPVGTKFFKEFAVDGQVIETRMIHKSGEGEDGFGMVAYAWTADGSDAEAVPDGIENAAGTRHDIPKETLCRDCHGGEPGRVLGFSAVQLRASDPSGLDLETLAAEGRLPDNLEEFRVPGTATVAAMLGMFHVNCGTCHNPEGPAWEETDINLRLYVDETEPERTQIYESTIDQNLESWRTPLYTWRVEPGVPDESGVLVRMLTRGTDAQMPPFATEEIDEEATESVRRWILDLGP